MAAYGCYSCSECCAIRYAGRLWMKRLIFHTTLTIAGTLSQTNDFNCHKNTWGRKAETWPGISRPSLLGCIIARRATNRVKVPQKAARRRFHCGQRSSEWQPTLWLLIGLGVSSDLIGQLHACSCAVIALKSHSKYLRALKTNTCIPLVQPSNCKWVGQLESEMI